MYSYFFDLKLELLMLSEEINSMPFRLVYFSAKLNILFPIPARVVQPQTALC